MVTKTHYPLGHAQHKLWITVVIIITVMLGLYFGANSYGYDYISHNVEIVNVTLTFVNTVLLLIAVAILVRIEEHI